jgi:hypothetical protein
LEGSRNLKTGRFIFAEPHRCAFGGGGFPVHSTGFAKMVRSKPMRVSVAIFSFFKRPNESFGGLGEL